MNGEDFPHRGLLHAQHSFRYYAHVRVCGGTYVSWVRGLQQHHLITDLELSLFGHSYQGQPPGRVHTVLLYRATTAGVQHKCFRWMKLSISAVPYC